MNERARVSLTDTTGTHTGTVTVRQDDGMCMVKWDGGITERIHESELELLPVGAPSASETAQAYAADDPKHPGWRERLASLWDSRLGK